MILSAGSQLIDAIGVSSYINILFHFWLTKAKHVILMVHSQSGQFGWVLGDANPSKVKGIVALEPTGPPFGEAVFSTVMDRPYGM